MAAQYAYVMKGMTKSFPGAQKPVLSNISLQFYQGAKIGIVGPNGAGKSTLIKIMAGIDKDFTGEAWPGENITVGYLPQEPELDKTKTVLENVKDGETWPVLIHVVTKKGKGYEPAESSADKYHGVSKFNVITGAQAKAKPNAPAYTAVFADALVEEARHDDKIVGITAAMPNGTGLDKLQSLFPERTFDVGIAEQHAVTFAAGLAAEGFKPFCALYSTFLQRGYDQVVHDVAIQRLPVRFAIDRAGLVGADGATHAGSFDVAFLANLPGIVVMAAADEAEGHRAVEGRHMLVAGQRVVRHHRMGPGPGESGKQHCDDQNDGQRGRAAGQLPCRRPHPASQPEGHQSDRHPQIVLQKIDRADAGHPPVRQQHFRDEHDDRRTHQNRLHGWSDSRLPGRRR